MGKKARGSAPFLLVCCGYAAVASSSSSWSMERICSRSSGVSWWPCTVFACRTASSRTSSSVPEMTIEQDFSDGKRRQSITLRCSAIVPPWKRRDYRPVLTRVQPIWFLICVLWAGEGACRGDNRLTVNRVLKEHEAWVTECTGYIGNNLGPIGGLSSGSSKRFRVAQREFVLNRREVF